jgi:hypothetical protein
MTSSQASESQIKSAANAAMASLLNLTLLPVISFIILLLIYRKSETDSINRYHAMLGIKLNIIAAGVLFAVSGLMILLGGFNSPWTWVYVISYFTLVHTGFIIIAVWALVRSWSGEKLKKDEY